MDEPTLNNGKQGHPWCMLDFNLTLWNIYEKFINIFHLTAPLVLNIMSIICFLLYKTKLELVSMIQKAENSRFAGIIAQLFKYKLLLIRTIIIIILEIPRFILTFAFAILFVYILLSPKYKGHFRTVIKNKFRIPSFRNL